MQSGYIHVRLSKSIILILLIRVFYSLNICISLCLISRDDNNLSVCYVQLTVAFYVVYVLLTDATCSTQNARGGNCRWYVMFTRIGGVRFRF